ncbi:tetratricopeptide repeat protein [Vibrio makurazakiensis]|uniref:tetratricopeptide repeat protein n=1 Tax=Vibrio makurazakiensis TaxID=2910250 RepID=UPI003D14AB08
MIRPMKTSFFGESSSSNQLLPSGKQLRSTIRIFINLSVMFSAVTLSSSCFALEQQERANLVQSSTVQADSLVEQQESVLAEYSQNEALPLDQRVASTVALGSYYGPNAIIAVARASRSQYYEMRIAAIQAAGKWQGRAKWDVVSPLLSDSSAPVKAEAVRTLIVLWPELSQSHVEVLEPSVSEHLENLPFDVEGDLERAWFYRIQNKSQLIEPFYAEISKKYHDPRISIVHAEYLKDTQQHARAITFLEQSLESFPENPALHYSLALAYHRQNETAKVKAHLKRAYESAPSNVIYGYSYATVLRESNTHDAAKIYERIYGYQPEPEYLYALCDTQLSIGENAEVCLDELKKVAPAAVVTDLESRY